MFSSTLHIRCFVHRAVHRLSKQYTFWANVFTQGARDRALSIRAYQLERTAILSPHYRYLNASLCNLPPTAPSQLSHLVLPLDGGRLPQ